MERAATLSRRPLWRRLVLLLVNLPLAGGGLIWVGRYRLGIALFLAGSALPYVLWALPPSRNNERLIGLLILIWLAIALAVFLLWSTIKMWASSRDRVRPFPERWHWPFWAVLALFLVINVFVPERWVRPLRSFYFPSASMAPTLDTVDRALADMRGVDALARGDVVIYLRQGQEYAKRIVAVGGDRIAMRSGVPVINGIAARQRLVGIRIEYVEGFGEVTVSRFTETLPGAPPHDIQDMGPTPQDDLPELRVPPGTVFVLGDNRDNADDSRFNGPISTDFVQGRLFLHTWAANRRKIGAAIR